MAELIAGGILTAAKVLFVGFHGYRNQKHLLPGFQQMVMTADQEVLQFKADYEDVMHFIELNMYDIFIPSSELNHISKFLSDYQTLLEDCKTTLNLSRLDLAIGALWGPDLQIQRQSLDFHLQKLRLFHSSIKEKLEPHGRVRQSTLDHLQLADAARVYYGDPKRTATATGTQEHAQPLRISIDDDPEGNTLRTSVRINSRRSEPSNDIQKVYLYQAVI